MTDTIALVITKREDTNLVVVADALDELPASFFVKNGIDEHLPNRVRQGKLKSNEHLVLVRLDSQGKLIPSTLPDGITEDGLSILLNFQLCSVSEEISLVEKTIRDLRVRHGYLLAMEKKMIRARLNLQ